MKSRPETIQKMLAITHASHILYLLLLLLLLPFKLLELPVARSPLEYWKLLIAGPGAKCSTRGHGHMGRTMSAGNVRIISNNHENCGCRNLNRITKYVPCDRKFDSNKERRGKWRSILLLTMLLEGASSHHPHLAFVIVLQKQGRTRETTHS